MEIEKYEIGITNLGNTCFINSALQCLFRIRRMTMYFKSGSFKDSEEWDEKPEHLKTMCEEWEDLSEIYSQKREGPSHITPGRFYSNFRDAAVEESMDWLIHGQNDSHEFMMFFLDVLHKGVSKKITDVETFPFLKNSGKPSSKTFVGDHSGDVLSSELDILSNANWCTHFEKEYHTLLTPLFHGQFMTIIQSKKTKEQSFTFEPFSSINLAVANVKKTSISIYDCLGKYFTTENMIDDDQWSSPKAGHKVDAQRATRIWRLPETLILSLKRFTMMGEKIDTSISFPLKDLDMKKYVVGPRLDKKFNTYDLTGIILHYGILGGGHYIAIVRNPGGKTWQVCDDSRTKTIPESKVDTCSSSVYALVYQRKDIVKKDDELEITSK